MSILEEAVRRLLAERDRDVGTVGYRLDLWNDLAWAYEAVQAPPAAPGFSLDGALEHGIVPRTVRPGLGPEVRS